MKQELEKLEEKSKLLGYKIVPLSVYNKNGIIKVKIALARGKKNYDKRESIKKRDLSREIKNNY